jgi:hypothetical protein
MPRGWSDLVAWRSEFFCAIIKKERMASVAAARRRLAETNSIGGEGLPRTKGPGASAVEAVEALAYPGRC